MTPEQNRRKICREALEWIGTPFHPHQARKKVGADCVHLALAIYQNAGAIPESIRLPQYRIGSADHRDSNLVIEWLSVSEFFSPVSEWPQEGDLITLRIGRVDFHVGIMLDNMSFVHAMRPHGVRMNSLRDSTFSRRLQSSWRPTICLDQPKQ